jgi:predicted Zn finger-like uncharacterized protein
MVITISCPACSSSFPVDPEKIPPNGVNARCSQCGDVFRLERPSEAEPAPPVVEEPEPLPGLTPPEAESPSLDEVEVSPPPPQTQVPPPDVPDTPAEVPPLPPLESEVEEARVEEAPAAEAPAVEPATEEPEPAGGGFRFGKRDPTDKAKRLARVLVSDMIMYNADRHVSALEAGTLKEDFEEEIEKSWKEFVEQVGPELAEGAGQEFWTDALNDILAKGEKLF